MASATARHRRARRGDLIRIEPGERAEHRLHAPLLPIEHAIAVLELQQRQHRDTIVQLEKRTGRRIASPASAACTLVAAMPRSPMLAGPPPLVASSR